MQRFSAPNLFLTLFFFAVGYHAEKVGNTEIKTPSIDEAAKSGIIMDRGYMTPWCAPSRATFQTGRTNSFNQNVSNDIFSFDDSIGFVAGMPPGTVTLAHALKDYSKTTGKGVYKASYAGKWGIGTFQCDDHITAKIFHTPTKWKFSTSCDLSKLNFYRPTLSFGTDRRHSMGKYTAGRWI